MISIRKNLTAKKVIACYPKKRINETLYLLRHKAQTETTVEQCLT